MVAVTRVLQDYADDHLPKGVATAATNNVEDSVNIRSEDSSRCFLCDPEPEFTWAESDHFRAVLGIGPVGEGFTLIAAREHLPSMLDLSQSHVRELNDFTNLVRERLGKIYGDTVLAEHGRVAACVEPMTRAHEPHCLHAHRLVFPNIRQLELSEAAPGMEIQRYNDFELAHDYYNDCGQYLYVEDDRGVQIGRIEGRLPRQFLRAIIALKRGCPELADWRRRPGFHEVEAARRALAVVAA